jgi:alpha-D-ribose 1-methylphosphonate 5-phosphate C-P lyase
VPVAGQIAIHCAICGARDSYLDEIILDDQGKRMFVCSDTDHCARQRAAG